MVFPARLLVITHSAGGYHRCARLCVTAQTASGGDGGSSASRRRSQRLARQGRTQQRAPDLLLEREARVAELQRLQQQQQQQGVPVSSADAVLDPQEDATRGLGQDLEPEGRQVADELADVPDAGIGLPAAAENMQDGIAGAAAANSVEADYVLEPQGPQPPGLHQDGQEELEISRQSEALLAILQAGEHVEEVIAQHRADIDDSMLQLLARRMKAAELLEKQEAVLQGLQLLYRRLKAEVDRQLASPGLRLLDELMSILDLGEGDLGSPAAAREERRAQAAAHLRAAFSGSLVGDADVLSLAAQLSASGGSQLADQLVADPVDPMVFMAEATELLRRVEEQHTQLEAYLQQQRQEEGTGQSQEAVRASLEVEQLLEQRQAAVALVQECLQVEAFMFGSVPLRAVLPDGDIDISFFATAATTPSSPSGNGGEQPGHRAGASPPGDLRDTWASQLLRALEREAVRPDAPFKIRDVQIIQAEVKLVKCVVHDVVVDVSFDTVGGLCTVAFLEAADRRIGRQHLFKRSILLLKAWCYYESRLLGAHHGLISSYALEVLVLYIFNLHHAELHTPLDVLRRFLAVLGSFDWERYCLALQGPLPIADLHKLHVDRTALVSSGTEPLLDADFMRGVLQHYSVQHLSQQQQQEAAGMQLVAPRFPLKHLNIVDPLLPSNNLGRSVSKASYARVKKALALGNRMLEEALLKRRRPRSGVQLTTIEAAAVNQRLVGQCWRVVVALPAAAAQ
ncbi:hypothetical protein CHLNCDRAFT_58914 [Chlorella variabilis]|uniref:PAP/OAS1 substrate-binding-related domain-containing protein n=1 Tax=Chlorella variabilis TaxID=554065 RepID=E1ZPC3_CHLVA|nr:hypothetical protein CHLNCDRAFT_58914 [Chlorella variabilis]EFN52312.1 hypothetical protein CHLNCDRAFT_58914 [Chlorella variabilis]|eukprot:XP_005844414.1 hypothetical protein CHLNCDRAFT_58914 [Chlorella variabilis]